MRKITRPDCPNLDALSTNYKHPDNKTALINASYGKCMYCESKVLHVSYGDVEHIKPKSKFPTLEFEWTNLGFVCSKCNIAKGDKYEEATSYIDPYLEDPDDYIVAFGAFLRHKKGSERAELTIKDIDLNREGLIEKRQTRIKEIEIAIDRCHRTQNETLKKTALGALIEEAKEDKEYSLFIKTLFKIHNIS